MTRKSLLRWRYLFQQSTELVLPRQCSAVKLLPERRSGCKTFTGTAFRPVPAPLHPWSPHIISSVYIAPTLKHSVIKNLYNKTRGGPDGMPPTCFIYCCQELCYPLSLFFTLSFDNSILPASWLISCIRPTSIFKKGNIAEADNYRPTALTATMCKLLESVIKD